MQPGARFIASRSRLKVLRLNALLLWLAGFLFADLARAVVLGGRSLWDWVGLASAALITASVGYQLNLRLRWIDRALPAAIDREEVADSAV